ncbi:DUF202 domain-containing protein [Rhodococcus sp. NPDC058514]|uniref:DUF202 domain-containing protein n=1 Tax=unclassified Rhodococcus (in: high G+C Gram-positive bacteria) TaxID=192944 RepID=UPI00365FE9AF
MSGRTDPGLQPERTELAWVRTAASLAAVAVLYLRFAPAPWTATAVAGGSALIVAAGVLVSSSRRHERACAGFAAGRARPAVLRNAVLVAQVLVLAVVAGAAVTLEFVG